MATVFREPVFTNRNSAKSGAILDAVPNLLLTTLYATALLTGQVRQSDYPNPVLRKTVPYVQIEVNTRLTTTAPVPFAQRDYPNPVLRTRVVIPDYIPDLLNTTLRPVGTPFVPVDFPNPILRKYVPYVQTEVDTRLTTVAPVPFAQRDYPNPILRKRVVIPDYIPDLLNTTLRVVTGTPFTQTDWPNPVLRKRTPQVQDEFNLRNRVVPSAVNPFTQTDWPNPIPYARVDKYQAAYFGISNSPPLIVPTPPTIYFTSDVEWQKNFSSNVNSVNSFSSNVIFQKNFSSNVRI